MGKSGYGQANYRNIQNFNQPPMHAARQQDAEYSGVDLVGSSIDVYHCLSAAISGNSSLLYEIFEVSDSFLVCCSV